ncbi:hypothetical protein SBDP1_590039 [Syntrophobacter sp. SbD1]|nr:hypothetical protein SBDP1_590039 [Syntrophobacter sp. SbD1]
MQKITPFLWFDDKAEEAANFYVAVFSARDGNSKIISVHPETPDVTLTVSNSERRHFSSWQGNRVFARRRTYVRRTSKPED